ncbi:MAG TPA: hypothetical protein VKT70_11765, partial [Stellaceae bacterium]|nr:hypothetical protein [Stellaceae bacterium]
MKRGAISWAVLVLLAALYLGFRVHQGITFDTNLLALLPQEERDPGVERAKDHLSRHLGARILLLLGDEDPARARAAAAALAQSLREGGLARDIVFDLQAETARSLAQVYFPYRFGLLSGRDRALLEEGRGGWIEERVLAAVFGPASFADAALLRQDPFLLLPDFLADLPSPLPRLAPDHGVLAVHEGAKTYVALTLTIAGDAFALDFQNRFIAAFGAAESELLARFPSLEILRFGAIFYAHAGAAEATSETSLITIVSLLGTILLILAVFRGLRPLLLTLVALGVGVIGALSASLAWFGTLHVAALLFGTSLIGIALDYCLQYLTARFDREAATPMLRLQRVLPGISLGLITTMIGYVTLVLAPFPGLRQVALFSAIGLMASFATVILWLPLLDRGPPLTHGGRLLRAADWLWEFWETPRFRRSRLLLCIGLALASLAGLARFQSDDDVHHLQALSPDLKRQETRLRALTGLGAGSLFLLVRGPSGDAVLEEEESLLEVLHAAKITVPQALARFVPSLARQRLDRRLIATRLLAPYLRDLEQRLGLEVPPPPPDPGFLVAEKLRGSPLQSSLDLVVEEDTGGAAHLMALQGDADEAALRAIVASHPGTTLLNPAAEVSGLLGQYRTRATLLVLISAGLMAPVVMWRYRRAGGFRVMIPPLLALALTPLLAALGGEAFTFFHAMALVLVLSIGFDYAVFCRESTPAQRAVTMLGVWLAMVTTLLSFGLLALSHVFAVHGFGLTLLIGTSLAFFFAPLAGDKGMERARMG